MLPFAVKPQIVTELKALLVKYQSKGRGTPDAPQMNDVEIHPFPPYPAPGKAKERR